MPFVSNLTGGWAEHTSVGDPDYWAGQLLGTVRLADGLRTLADSGAKVLVELGPGDGLGRQAAGGALGAPARASAVALLGRDPGREDAAVLRGLGRLWERGVDVPWDELTPTGRGRLVSLPPHPMSGTRCRPAPGRDRTGDAGEESTGLQAAEPQATEPRSAGPRSFGTPSAPARTGQDGSGEARTERLAALWRAALGVDTALAGDDFYELGGSSLMIVGLLARVRAETGVQIPAAAVAAALTFRRLVELVGERAPGEAAPTTADTAAPGRRGPTGPRCPTSPD